MSIRRRDIGIVPLLVSLPFMFYPKVLEGDTQPWVLTAALIAFLSFRTGDFIRRRNGFLILLSFLCILTYALRSASGFFLLRSTYTYVTFGVLWVVCERAKGDYFPSAVKGTVIIWFVVGLYQFLATSLGYEIATSGRFLPGRMGPPSMTAEASYYGSLSIVQLMYILCERNAKNALYIICAVGSVVLSGSLLAMILLFFPLLRLPRRLRTATLALLPLLVAGDFYLTSAGLTSRLRDITGQGIGLTGLFLDASLNLRVGHIYFTMFQHVLSSLFLVGPIDFMTQYNQFAARSGLFIQTGTGYILPAIGEMIYGAGIFAVILLVTILRRAQENCTTKMEKAQRIAFILACMLNPITIANIFLVLYVQVPSAWTSGRHTRSNAVNVLS